MDFGIWAMFGVLRNNVVNIVVRFLLCVAVSICGGERALKVIVSAEDSGR